MLSDQRRTTAQDSVLELEQRGVDRADIRGEHLNFVYRTLRRMDDAPDFDGARAALRGVRPRQHGQEEHSLWAVMIETRPHLALDFTIQNTVECLGAPFQLFHGPETPSLSPFLRRMIDDGRLVMTPLRSDAVDGSVYNGLLCTPDFWDAVLGEEKVLIVQTDAVLCRSSPFSVDDFIEHDYIGVSWGRNRGVGIVADGGCGGLSLRDKERTMECLRRFPPDEWPGGEDGYYALHLDVMGAALARMDECERFGCHRQLRQEGFGAHRISDMTDENLSHFLAYCPEARNILEPNDLSRAEAWRRTDHADARGG